MRVAFQPMGALSTRDRYGLATGEVLTGTVIPPVPRTSPRIRHGHPQKPAFGCAQLHS